MKKLIVALACLSLATSASAKFAGIGKDKVEARILDVRGLLIGKATIYQSKKRGLQVKIEVTGLTRGEHGVHLHTVGSCEGPVFAGAGAHWNPAERSHGLSDPGGGHAGDLPNLLVGFDGKGKLKFDIPGHALNSVMDEDGVSIVIHAQADDQRTDPSGNSGGRVACGVFTAG
jgi:superoxide dismutase, Cu-Zn family